MENLKGKKNSEKYGVNIGYLNFVLKNGFLDSMNKKRVLEFYLLNDIVDN